MGSAAVAEITVTLRHQAPGSADWTGYSVRVAYPDRPTMSVLISVLEAHPRSEQKLHEEVADDLRRLGEALLDAARDPVTLNWGRNYRS